MGGNFPLYHAKQVEILYGPASVVYGADAFSGVINVITKRNKDSQGKVVLGFGQDGSKTSTVNWFGSLGDSWRFSGGMNWVQDSNFDYLVEDFQETFG